MPVYYWITIRKKEKKQEVGEDLNECMLNLLSEVCSLRILVVITLVKVEMLVFQIVPWSNKTTWLKVM